MKCPLLTAISFALREDAKATDNDCWKEECAWWDEEANMCSEKLKNRMLLSIEKMLGFILVRMPHEGQFRK